MEGCFKFQWGGVFFQMGRGFIFKWGAPHAGGIDLDEKNVGWGEGTPPPPLWETLRLPCVEHSDF